MPHTNVFRTHSRNRQYENRLSNGYHASPWDVLAHVCEYLSGLIGQVSFAYMPTLNLFHALHWVGEAEYKELTADTDANRYGKVTGNMVVIAFAVVDAGQVAINFGGKVITVSGGVLMAGFQSFCNNIQTLTTPR